MHASAADIAALELLAVELDLSRAVSVARASVISRERDRPVVASERAVSRDRTLVLDDMPRPGLGVSGLFGFAIGPGRQADLDVGARQVLARRQEAADPVLRVRKERAAGDPEQAAL
jgi:hypothetical protein